MNRENKHLFVRFLRQYFKLNISTLVVLLSFSITSFSDPLSSNYGKKSTFLPPLITSSLSDYNGMNISCHGLNDGWIDITVNGIGPFTYSWSTGAITEDISNLVAGTYTVTVTDANSESTIETFILREPDEIVISDNVSNTTCANNNGSIDITVTGGMPAFTYLWSNNAITEDITGLAAGGYTVTVTDINNCKDSAAFVVASSTQPVIVIDSVKNISCFNGTDGAVYISVSGNNGPVSYAWSNGSISEDLLNVVVGNYTLTITDSLGCIATTSQAITQPTDIAATLTPVSATCGQNNGSITTSVSGGTPTYTYLWNTGATTSSITNVAAGTYTVTVTDSKLCTKAFSQTISNLAGPVVTVDSVKNVSCFGGTNGAIYISVTGNNGPVTYLWSTGAVSNNLLNVVAGNYTVTVTDSSGCVATKSQVITQPASALSITVSSLPASCGSANGSASASVTGGTPAYTYLWNTGQTSSSITNVAGGSYTVTVTDSKGCTTSKPVLVNTQSSVQIVIDSIIQLRCFGQNTGAILTHATGGSGVYTYTWTPAQANNDSIFNLGPGTYKLVVHDNANCADSITVTINPVLPLVINGSALPEVCSNNNGSAWATVSGGTPPYNYLWSTGSVNDTIFNLSKGNYTVTVTDSKLCTATHLFIVDSLGGPSIQDSVVNIKCFGGNNGAIYTTVSGGNGAYSYQWSPGGQTTSFITGLTAGTYIVTVSDTNACTATKVILVTQPSAINIALSAISEKCNKVNGIAIASASGGTGPYTYLWNTGVANDSLINKASGWYSVTVTDANLCTKVDSVFIPHINGPTINGFTRSNPVCNSDSTGSLTVNVSGGTPAYTYQWSAPAGVTGASNTNIPAGIYTVTVTDINGCSATSKDTLFNPPLLVISHSSTNASCALNNGIAIFNVTGGATPYSYLWSNGATGTNQQSTLSNGTYTITVTDGNGCVKQDTVIVNRTPATMVQLDSSNNVSCYGLSDGNIYITPSGGIGNYSYQWSYNNLQTQDLTNIPGGTYTVTVTDGAGCSYTMPDINILSPDSISITFTTTPTGCSGPTGSATAQVTGGTAPYTYIWSDGSTNATAVNLANQNYTVTVTDQHNCSKSVTVNIPSTLPITASVSSFQNVTCYGDSTGSIQITAGGGTPPLTYLWSNGATTANISQLTAGTYTVTITDAVQCTTTITQTITQNPQLQFGLILIPGPCNGGTPGSAVASPSGGSSVPTLLWSDGSTGTLVQGVAGTVFTLTITDNSGCHRDTTFSIPSTNGPQIVSVNTTDIVCFGDSSGTATIQVTGGASPITYQWIGTSPVQNTATAVNLTQGNYTCIVSDVNGCTASAAVTINHLFTAIQPVLNINNASCGNSNGQISVTATGGSGGFVYALNNGAFGTDSVYSNIAPGVDTIRVKDNSGCIVTVLATVSNIQGPEITVLDSSNVSCFGNNDGSITLTVSGAAQPISYMWNDSVVTLSRNNLPPGNYTFTATDANNCVTVRSFVITEPPQIIITEIISQKNPPYNISCNGKSDGEINLFVTGGIPGTTGTDYSYQWSISGVTGATAGSLSAGPYTVTVTDSTGCSVTKSFTLTEPPALYAGNDFTVSICGIDTSTLTASTPLYGLGKWILKSGSAVIVHPDSVTTLINAIGNGVNVFAWVVYDNNCSDTAIYIINKKEKIIADAGIDQDVCDSFVFLSAVPPSSGSGIWSILFGTSQIENDSSAQTKVENLNPGVNGFIWTITNGNCSSSDTIKVTLLPPEQCYTDVVLPTGFTPNEDGYNDLYEIRGLDNNENKFSVYNRWGNLVYEKKNYRNNWDGRSNSNQILPDGTYYAIFSIPARNIILKTYIDLRR
ncbi:MAG: gliding motility-associated C-terminal domain-containing protein [Bacteroidia bacterium]|nr:gliding motility-associated C-terminal domain-containing protein [Bacteroidia bacterium]